MLESLARIFALIHKELLAILKDPRSRTVVIGPPIFQALLFGYALSYDLNQVPYALLDQDRSAASRALVARIEGSGIFQRVADLSDESQIARCIDDRKALVVVHIPHDFERDLSSGGAAPIQVIGDGRNSNTAGIAIGYVGAAVQSFNAAEALAVGIDRPPVQLISRAWYNPNFETRWNMIPALIGTLTLIGTLLLTALSVAREREQGTFDQLLVTPFRPGEIMIGKAVPSMIVGLIQATSILLLAQLWFKIPFAGSFLTLYAGLALFLLAAVGIGLFLSSLAATMQQAMLYAFVVIMPCTLLSGLMTPIANMPRLLQAGTLLNPLRYGIEIAQRVYLEGATVTTLLPLLWPLAIIGAVTLAISSWLFRHRLT